MFSNYHSIGIFEQTIFRSRNETVSPLSGNVDVSQALNDNKISHHFH